MKAGIYQIENNVAVVYFGSFLTMHNPLFFCSKIVTE